MTDDQDNDVFGPPSTWTMAVIVVMSIVTLILSGYMVYNYSGNRTTTAANPPAQTGFAPIVDEVRPAPSTTGQGGGERR